MLIKTLLTKKILIAAVSGLVVVSAVTVFVVSENEEKELTIEEPSVEKQVITKEQLSSDEDLLEKENSRCKELHPMEAMQDEVCVLVNQVKKEVRRKGYTDPGAPAVKLQTLPGM